MRRRARSNRGDRRAAAAEAVDAGGAPPGPSFGPHAATRRGMIAVRREAGFVALDRDLPAGAQVASEGNRTVAPIIDGRAVGGRAVGGRAVDGRAVDGRAVDGRAVQGEGAA